MIYYLYRLAFRLPILTILLLLSSVAMAGKVSVGDELERLSSSHGFAVVGLQTTEGADGRADGDELYPRLRRLLENFDHVIVQSPGGGVERVIILGEKVPFVPVPRAAGSGSDGGHAEVPAVGGDIVVKTERRGTQHSVDASLEGKAGKRISRSLLVDTGADFVVLPSTMLPALGLAPNTLKQREMQTANGTVTARVGTIPAVWLGEHRIAGVEVAFIDDEKLGSNGLLGMSVLSRYTMTIDDEAGRLTLADKTAGNKGAEGAGEPGEDAPVKEAAAEDAVDGNKDDAPRK